MQAGMGITDGIIQGKISCFRNKFHKHKEKCSEKRKFLGALCLRSESCPDRTALFMCYEKKLISKKGGPRALRCEDYEKEKVYFLGMTKV